MRWAIATIGLALTCGGCASVGVGTDRNADGQVTLHDTGLSANGPVLALNDRWGPRFSAAYAREAQGGEFDGDLRRELLYSLIADSNAKCDNYLVGLAGIQNSYDTGLNLGRTALVTAAGLSSPERSANLLAALAGFFGSTREEITNNVFGGKDIEVLSGAVMAGRATEEAILASRASAGAFDRWDATSVLREVHAYDQNCGISYGIRQLQEAVVVAQRFEAERLVDDGPRPVDAPAPPVTNPGLVVTTVQGDGDGPPPGTTVVGTPVEDEED